MKKVKLKLTNREVDILLRYLEKALAKAIPRNGIQRHVNACLTEMMHSLAVARVIDKASYKLSLGYPIALALLAYYENCIYKINDDETIRLIVGQIDQKTA